MVEDGNEGGVALPVDFIQFDTYQRVVLEDFGIEEVAAGIIRLQELAVFLLEDRFQLVDVAHQQKLFSTERFTHVAVVNTEYFVDEVDDVGSDHADFVDDNQFHFAQQLAFVTVVFQRAAEVASRVSFVGGDKRVEREFEEAVQCAAAGIDGGNAGRCEDNVFFLCGRSYIP